MKQITRSSLFLMLLLLLCVNSAIAQKLDKNFTSNAHYVVLEARNSTNPDDISVYSIQLGPVDFRGGSNYEITCKISNLSNNELVPAVGSMHTEKDNIVIENGVIHVNHSYSYSSDDIYAMGFAWRGKKDGSTVCWITSDEDITIEYRITSAEFFSNKIDLANQTGGQKTYDGQKAIEHLGYFFKEIKKH